MKKTNVMLMLRLYLVIIIFVISGSVTAIISQSKYENQKTIRIVLLGDSLIGRPYNNHDLSGRILGQIYPQTWVPYIELINSGNSGNKIVDILARVDSVLAEYNPHAVILFWDSDCSDVDESVMSKEEILALRSNYSIHIQEVGSKVLLHPSLRQSGCLAIAGPEVLGEGIAANPLEPSRFKGKDDMLNDYRNMTATVARSLGVNYIDVRQAFLDDCIEQQWVFYKDLDTEDGEHPNDRGSSIEAALFAKQINAWIANEKLPLPRGPIE